MLIKIGLVIFMGKSLFFKRYFIPKPLKDAFFRVRVGIEYKA